MKSNSEETYTFILGASFGDKTYKSLISFNLRQCIDYCKECESSERCSKCLYDESKSESCPSKNFSNLKFINIIIAVFIIALLLLSLFKIVPWYSYINACNHYHSMLFILFLSIANFNSLSYFYSFICIFPPYFSPLIILNLLKQNFKEIITSERKLISLEFYFYLRTNTEDLIPYLSLSLMFVYFIIIITKLCAKQHFLKYSKALLDNSSIYYSIVNFTTVYCAFKSSEYFYYRDYYYYFEYIPLIAFIIYIQLLATVSLSNYSAYIDLKYALKAYSWLICI